MRITVVLFLSLFMGKAFSQSDKCTAIIESNICLSADWVEGPVLDAYSTLRVSFSDVTSGEALELDEPIEFKTWMIMDMHSHGGSQVVTSKEGRGQYLVDEIYFFSGMSGIWQLRAVYKKSEYVLGQISL